MVAIVIAHLADLCTFYLVVQIHPLAGESNPIIAPLWAVSPWMVAAYKAAGVIIALLILGRAHPRIRRWGTVAAIAVPLLGMATNTVAGLIG